MQYSDVAIAYFNQLRLCWWFQNIYQYIFPGKKKKEWVRLRFLNYKVLYKYKTRGVFSVNKTFCEMALSKKFLLVCLTHYGEGSIHNYIYWGFQYLSNKLMNLILAAYYVYSALKTLKRYTHLSFHYAYS